MAMEWQRVSIGGGEDSDGVVTVDRHWYLTEDRSRVVEEGHPDSRWLWASPGTQVPRRDAIRYGALVEEPEPDITDLVEGGMDPGKAAEAVAENPIELDEEPEKPAEEKKAPAAPNKARKAAPNKAAKTESEDK